LCRAIPAPAAWFCWPTPRAPSWTGAATAVLLERPKESRFAGATWSEILEGTNAIGTALVEQQLVQNCRWPAFFGDNRFLFALPFL